MATICIQTGFQVSSVDVHFWVLVFGGFHVTYVDDVFGVPVAGGLTN